MFKSVFRDKDYWNFMFNEEIQMRYPSEVVIRFLKSNFYQIDKKLNLLDLGCGNGNNSFMACELGFNVWAMDYSEAAINELTKRNTPPPDTTRTNCAWRYFERYEHFGK